MVHKLLTKFFIWIYLFILLVTAEFLIEDSKQTIYLETSFSNTLDHIFPSNLEISAYFTHRLNGLIFYSIDRNSNQLIVNLQNGVSTSMHVEFRGENHIISMSDLCKCQDCLNEILRFQFKITNFIEIQCNQNQIVQFPFRNYKEYNNKYPVPSFDSNLVSAYLWLINTPKYDNRDNKAYPNNEYLTGCLYNITYRGIPINFTKIGPVAGCSKQCTPGVCNGGECIETFNSKPNCNCTETFLNGEFCNSTVSSFGTFRGHLQFKILKLSWNCARSPLIQMTNKDKEMYINVSKDNFLYWQYNNLWLNFTNEITKNYSKNENYIVIITFEGQYINIQFKVANEKWKYVDIFINEIDASLHFNQISFHNRSCQQGDIVYKQFSNEVKWKLLNMKKIENSNSSQSKNDECKNHIGSICKHSSDAGITILGVLGAVDIILLIPLIALFVLRNKRKNKPLAIYESVKTVDAELEKIS